MKLAEWMTKNNIDDAAMATRIGSDRSTVSRIRRAKMRPSWDLADRISKQTGAQVTPNDYIAAPADDSQDAAA